MAPIGDAVFATVSFRPLPAPVSRLVLTGRIAADERWLPTRYVLGKT